MKEERMTVATVDICSCGLVMHQYDEDDYDTLGTDCSVLCPDCGNEKFTTIKQLQAELDEANEQIDKLRKHNSECTMPRFSARGCTCGLFKKVKPRKR